LRGIKHAQIKHTKKLEKDAAFQDVTNGRGKENSNWISNKFLNL